MRQFNGAGLRRTLQTYWHFYAQKYRHAQFSIPNRVWDPGYTVELALTRPDLEAVFKLQHESAVARGLIKPHASGMKCSVYHFLPHTHHVVVKMKGVVIASVTMIADSPLGLPADKFFADEVNQTRQGGQKLVEVASFVIDRGYKASAKALNHLLMKYVFNYVRRYTEGTELVVTVHPSVAESYETNWFFRPRSEVIKFHSSKKALTLLMTHPLSRQHRKFFMRSFPVQHVNKNTALFILKRDARFTYPFRVRGKIFHPVMTPEMLEYFFLDKTNLYEELDLNTRQMFLEIYLQFFGEAEISRFLNTEREMTLKEFRIPVSTEISIKAGPQFFSGHVRDLTANGCFVELPQEIRASPEPIILTFHMGDAHFQVEAKLSWRNTRQQLRYGPGYGMQFAAPVQQLKNEIQNWVHPQGRRAR